MSDGPAGTLARIERYYDEVPRVVCRVERLGPLELFVNREGPPDWSYYARPALGSGPVGAADVAAVRARQRRLGVPEALEWVEEITPSLTPAARAAGLAVDRVPLMLLVDDPAPRRADVRLLDPDAPDLAALSIAVSLGFAEPGTAVGTTGLAEARARLATVDEADARLAATRVLMRRGLTVSAAAYVDGAPVAGGSHNPRGEVTEIAGVATLPAYRRRGLGAAVVARLVADARERGCRVVFLSAHDDAVARIYAEVGFRRIGTACLAEPARR